MIICISGPRGSGKSLLASYLEHYHAFTRFSLADELKREVMRDWKLPASMLWGKDKEISTGYKRRQGQPLTARDIMIRHGEYRRSIDELYWCKLFDPRIGDNIVIDDLRFKNEMEFFKQHRAIFVRIERKPELNVFKAALDDLSETELNEIGNWDFKLNAEENINAEDLKRFAEYLVLHSHV
jgi:hypothetical protein